MHLSMTQTHYCPCGFRPNLNLRIHNYDRFIGANSEESKTHIKSNRGCSHSKTILFQTQMFMNVRPCFVDRDCPLTVPLL